MVVPLKPGLMVFRRYAKLKPPWIICSLEYALKSSIENIEASRHTRLFSICESIETESPDIVQCDWSKASRVALLALQHQIGYYLVAAIAISNFPIIGYWMWTLVALHMLKLGSAGTFQPPFISTVGP